MFKQWSTIPPQISTEQTITSFLKSPSTKKAMTHADGNSGTVMVHSQNVAELNQLMGSQSPSWQLMGSQSPSWQLDLSWQYRFKQTFEKHCTDSHSPKKTPQYHKNERQHKHGQYNSRISQLSYNGHS